MDRAKRRELAEKIIKKRLAILKKYHNTIRDSDGKTYYERMAAEPHRMAKHHPLDCGNSKCGICRKPEKYLRKELRRKLRGKEVKE